MGHVVLVDKLVRACRKAEIGSTVDHIQTKGNAITEQRFKMLCVLAHFKPLEIILSPMSKPTRVNFTTKYNQLIPTEVLQSLKFPILTRPMPTTESD
jgi:hypothetical protein